MEIRSPSFKNNENIPPKFTCDGDDINPSIQISNIPKNAKYLVLIVDDPDAPLGVWIHWVVFNIPVTSTIQENSIPGTQGINSFRRVDFGGPCPPSGTHRYFFKVYALDQKLNLLEGASLKEVEGAMKGHILEKAELIGLYKKR